MARYYSKRAKARMTAEFVKAKEWRRLAQAFKDMDGVLQSVADGWECTDSAASVWARHQRARLTMAAPYGGPIICPDLP